MVFVKVACCNLNQWAMDFDHNLTNIKNSIIRAKSEGCVFRTGPELEITGYTCEDHFLEPDTFEHSWESIADILKSDLTDGILCDIGMPIIHNGVPYNCRIYILDRRPLLIRPKMALANDGNYRELRYFAAWPSKSTTLHSIRLPPQIAAICQINEIPFGNAILRSADGVMFASESCEELFTADSPHIPLALNGAHVIANGSGSHFSLRKLDTRLRLIQMASSKCGGCYLCLLSFVVQLTNSLHSFRFQPPRM